LLPIDFEEYRNIAPLQSRGETGRAAGGRPRIDEIYIDLTDVPGAQTMPAPRSPGN